ncbi:MAG: hypothetical protein WDO70_00650 [Alphaproteobacteria bacterium]
MKEDYPFGVGRMLDDMRHPCASDPEKLSYLLMPLNVIGDYFVHEFGRDPSRAYLQDAVNAYATAALAAPGSPESLRAIAGFNGVLDAASPVAALQIAAERINPDPLGSLSMQARRRGNPLKTEALARWPGLVERAAEAEPEAALMALRRMIHSAGFMKSIGLGAGEPQLVDLAIQAIRGNPHLEAAKDRIPLDDLDRRVVIQADPACIGPGPARPAKGRSWEPPEHNK